MITTEVSLGPEVQVRSHPDGSVRAVTRSGGLSLGGRGRALVERLAAGPCDLISLLAVDLVGAHALLVRLGAVGLLRTTLRRDGRPLLSLPGLPVRRSVIGPLVMSRFALLRRDDDRLVIESSRTGVTVQVHDVAVLTLLAEPARHLSDPELAEVLVSAGILVPATAEDDDFDLASWSPHELWFHTHSRARGDGRPWGGTRWAEGRFAPLPARRPEFPGPMVELPDPGAPGAPILGRTNRRQDHANPLTLLQLGEFLHRTAGIRRLWPTGDGELLERPFPSGGALHELEVYPVVTAVQGMEPGLYHYDSSRHVLPLVCPDGPLVRELTQGAARAANLDRPPQVLLVISARFGRVMWKYQAMAYALTLKNTGVLMAAMYAVATRMGLAPCALGGGDSRLFARATGLDVMRESSVGEFVLGSASMNIDTNEGSDRQ